MFGKGMEMMVISAIKAAGIDPDEVMGKANQLIHNVNFQLDRFGQRLDSIDERLARIETALDITPVEVPENQTVITFEGDANDQ